MQTTHTERHCLSFINGTRSLTSAIWRAAVLVCGVAALTVHADIHYVSPSGGNVAPYTSWASAATTIQAAIDSAVDGDSVAVGTGTYYLSVQISLVKAITVSSVYGSASTIIDGGNTVRCLEMNRSGAVVEGFTMMNAYWYDRGGGAHVTAGLLNRCVLRKNVTGDIGGGAALDGMAAEVRNCLVYNNQAAWGGGIYAAASARIVSCTIVSNYSPLHHGGGVTTDNIITCRNSIISYNFTSNIFVGSGALVLEYTCAPTAKSGAGNITNDPAFVSLTGANYHLMWNSPCIDAGTNLAWMTGSCDLDGNARNSNGRVDIGAYELGVFPFVDITSTPYTVSSDIASFSVAGTNNSDVFGDMSVSNATIGGTGVVFPAQASWIAPPIGLGEGENILVVSGSNRFGAVTSDWIVITQASTGTNVPIVDITNVSATVGNDVMTYAVAGSNNLHVLGGMWVANTAVADPAQSFPATVHWSAPAVNLAVGTNVIVVVGTNLVSVAATDTVEIIRGPYGTGRPVVDVTNGAMVVANDVSWIVVAGTNNPNVVGDMWVTNESVYSGAASFPSPMAGAWNAPAMGLVVGANVIRVCGTNAWGTVASDAVTVTRGGAGTPFVDITNAASILSYYTMSFTMGGTNNINVVPGMWWTNLFAGTYGVFSHTASVWTCTVTGLLQGTNTVRVYGTNVSGAAAFDTITLRRGFEQNRPLLDPLTNITVREHQVVVRQISGLSNIDTVLCDTGAFQGVCWFDTNAWRFSCIPSFGVAGQTMSISFIGVNQYGMETQMIAVTVAVPAKGIGPKKPLRYEDEDGDIIDVSYSGIRKAGSVVVFDGQNLVVSNAIPDGKLAFTIKQNKKTGGNGMFELRNVQCDNGAKSMMLYGNVWNIQMLPWRVETMKLSPKGGMISNVFVASAKNISTGKGTLVGTVCATNGFETFIASVVDHGRIFAGLDAAANPSNTPARATFKTVKVQVMMASCVAGRDMLVGMTLTKPVIKVKTPVSSLFYHTKADNTIQIEQIPEQ